MFADACQRVSEFIRPVVVSTRLQNGEVRTQCGTFIVVNRDGWVITAGHLYDSFVKYQTDLNKLREIKELLMDTGVGKSAYSVLEQGKIDQIISMRPEDRRYIFEEAAGISKFKQQCNEANNKILKMK